MNRIRTLVPLIAAAIFQTTPSLIAQQPSYRADVPFQFAVQDTTLPAGTYRITREGAFLHIENEKQRTGLYAVMSPVESTGNGPNHLVFDEVNGFYFLRELDAPSSGRGMELAVSHTEKKAITLARASLKNPVMGPQVTIVMGAQ